MPQQYPYIPYKCLVSKVLTSSLVESGWVAGMFTPTAGGGKDQPLPPTMEFTWDLLVCRLSVSPYFSHLLDIGELMLYKILDAQVP